MTQYDFELLDKQFHRINVAPYAEGLLLACAFSVIIVFILLGSAGIA
jgi:hypothetical protein